MMKKQYLYLAFAASVMLMTSSCSQDDTPVVPTAPTEEEADGGVEQSACDELQMFQNYIVRIDDEGNFVERVYGKALNEADTTVVSIGADNVEEAREIFERWLAIEPNVQETAPNALTYYPKDEDGEGQGEIYFTPVSDDPTCIARVTFSAGTSLRHFRQIDFILHSLWPENDAPDPNKHLWQKWDGDQSNFTEGYTWTCVRLGDDGVPPLSVVISRYKDKNHNTPEYIFNNWFDTGTYFADPHQAIEASKVAKQDWDAFMEHCIPADIYGEEAYVDKKKDMVIDYGVYVVQLKKAKLKYYSIWDPRYSYSHHNYILCTYMDYDPSYVSWRHHD